VIGFQGVGLHAALLDRAQERGAVLTGNLVEGVFGVDRGGERQALPRGRGQTDCAGEE
jgi:hypothetical protein